MDDSCAVCAEPLQWVAYGPCGHREVCSTCVVRLRFICEDRRCCLCKRESRIIFVTKALGDFTRMITDFAIFPADPTEGRVGMYWYHEGTQAYFDDMDHYKMIKAMCRLSCSVCDNTNERRSEGLRRKWDFKNVEQLRSHLVNRHGLLMCSLCLESRKVFICEQKLYTKAQLGQHIKTGDSEVDGSETERGGFMGHPMCEFCRNPFYGENELYSHMSTEHYTCHICQRQHLGQYEYYKNYDELEIHFRQTHFLCEDETCLEKKFVVYATESEMKRHNAMEHSGRMSRCKRAAALQIPISFQYRRSTQQDRRGRGRGFPSDSANNQLSWSIQASLETANAESSCDTSSGAGAVSNHRETSEFESVGSFEVLPTTDCEPSSISSHASGQNQRSARLEDSSFPPLPGAPSRGKKKTKNAAGRIGGSSTASLLHHQNNAAVTIRSTLPSWPAPNSNSLVRNFQELRPILNSGLLSSSSSPNIVQSRSTTRSAHISPSYESPVSVRQVNPHELASSGTGSSSRNSTTNSTFTHSASSPNLNSRGFYDNSISSFPPVSAVLPGKATTTTSSYTLPKAEDVNAANKSLVERIRIALEHDEKKFTAFKEISVKYRQGLINTEEYLACVCQFGLSHLVLELAKLCPDPEKQRELVETYNLNTRSSGSQEKNLGNDRGPSKNRRSSKKGKEKCEENGISMSRDDLADSIISSMKKLESNYKSLLDRTDVLSKDGPQSAKGKSKILVDVEPSQSGPRSTSDSSKKNSGNGGAVHKQQKKTSKFLRNRLGENAAVALEHVGSDSGSDLNDEKIDEAKDPPEGLPVSGVWQNGGGRRLLAMTQRNHRK